MISIIVPVYKSEQTLDRCVESLLSQTDSDLEILLVVDGPPDNSGVMCEAWAKKDARIRVINQENQGVSRARNHGLMEAKGEYIRFVDSDDYVDKDSNELLLKALKEADADMSIAGYHHLYFGRDVIKLPKEKVYDLHNLSDADCSEFLELYIQGYLNMPWNKLYKKEYIKEQFPTDLNLGEDLTFNQGYILGISKIAVVKSAVCNYIQDDRVTTLSTKKRMDKIPIALRLYKNSIDFFQRMGIIDNGYPASKAVMEFLDDIEGLAYDNSLTKKDKLDTIKIYEKALDDLFAINGEQKIMLPLLDYKIIYAFYKRKATSLVYLLVNLRGVVVKLLKRRG